MTTFCTHQNLNPIAFDLWCCQDCGATVTFQLSAIGPHRASCQHLGGLVHLSPGRWRCDGCGQELSDLDLLDQRNERRQQANETK
jgi:ribosomal protein L37AE/L43A